MDLIDQLVGDLRPESCVFCRLEVREPWRIQKTASSVAPFYAVLSGSVCVACGTERHALSAGDFLVLPRGEAHEIMGMQSAGAKPVALLTLFAQAGIEPWKPGMRYRSVRLSYGEGKCDGIFLIGLFYFGEPSKNPLLAALPGVLTLRADQENQSALKGIVENISAELDGDRPGASMVIAKHADLLFVQTVRAYLQSELRDAMGWIRGMSDEFVGRALTAMHAAPARAWTLRLLADEAGCSRAVLAKRFKALVGEGALTYLTQWRMHIASGLLLRGEANVAAAALVVGYRPEAFASAFKRWSGVSPRDYRLHQLAMQGESAVPEIVSR